MTKGSKRRKPSFPSNVEVWALVHVWIEPFAAQRFGVCGMACSATQCEMHSIWREVCVSHVQALQLLAGRALVGALHWQDAHVVVHTGSEDADLLYNCGLGTGAGRRQRNSLVITDCTLSLEEAFFLQYALRCLTVHADASSLSSTATNAQTDAPHASHKSLDAMAARQLMHPSSAAAAAATPVKVRPTSSGHAAGTLGGATTTRGQSDPGTSAAAMLVPTQRSLNRQIIIQPGIHPPEPDYTAKSASAAPVAAPHADVDSTAAATPSRPPSECASADKTGLVSASTDPSTSVAQLQAEVQPMESRQAQHMQQERAEGSGRSLALTEEQLWTACSSLQPCWASGYATYHHFRCKVCSTSVLHQSDECCRCVRFDGKIRCIRLHRMLYNRNMAAGVAAKAGAAVRRSLRPVCRAPGNVPLRNGCALAACSS